MRCTMKNQRNGVVQVNGMLAACIGGALAIALWAAPAHADQPGMGSSRSSTVHDTVTITAIDKSNRSLSVKNADGDMRSIQVPADVKAFDRLKKGDKIDVDYTE